MRHRHPATKWAVGVCTGLVIVSTFMPWLRSGQRTRSSYELVGVARRLQEVPTAAMRGATLLWPAVPLLLVIGAILVIWDRPRPATLPGLVGAAYVGTFALVFWRLDIPPLAGVQVASTVVFAALSSLALSICLIVNAFIDARSLTMEGPARRRRL